MRNLLLVPTLMLAACATTGSSSKSSSAPFQGADKLAKRRAEIGDAAKTSMDCMKVKPGEQPGKGGVFAVMADAAGKLTVSAIKWDGSEAMKQCIVDAGSKATVTPLPGPSVGTLWDFVPPGEKSDAPKPPEDLAVKMQPLSQTMQAEVVECGTRNLGLDFGATIDVAYFLYNDGKAYAPTVISSDAKDGAFESCVQDVISHTKFPVVTVTKPFGLTAHFKIGVYGDTRRVQ
ncbi:MAG: hypothetical protein JWM53_3608 [bacterium]|nr:hypothetical protein [bacterium]